MANIVMIEMFKADKAGQVHQVIYSTMQVTRDYIQIMHQHSAVQR